MILKEFFRKKICISIPILIGIILILIIAAIIYAAKIESEVSISCGVTAPDCKTYCSDPCGLFNWDGFDAPPYEEGGPICVCKPLGR